MFVLCPHCQFLVAVDARTGLPPSACPKCGGAIVAETPGEAALAEPVAATQAAVPDDAIAASEPTPPTEASDAIATPAAQVEDAAPSAQLNADAVVAAMAGKPARKSRAKTDDAPKAARRGRQKPAKSEPAPEAQDEAAKRTAPPRPPRAPVGQRLGAWLSTLKPKAKPAKPTPAKPDAPATDADAKTEKRKATVKPIPSLRERAAKRAAALQEATQETMVESPSIATPSGEPDAIPAPLPVDVVPVDVVPVDVVPVEVPAIEAFAVEALTVEPPTPPPLPPANRSAPVVATTPPVPVAPPPIAPAPAPAAPPVVARKRTAAAAPSFARTHSTARLSMPARWRHIATIAGLSLLLVLQLLLAQRDALAANARWRPSIGALCALFRCSVPAWHQPDAFTMLSRDVRPHPSAPGTLRIDASFRNDARWAQAWPHLVVSLSDVDGRVVGTRAFSAREYLGAAPTQNTLASGQTAAIQLDVVEPAPGIVAFSFDFR
ncbi:DUF3426 domain-containing protein [Lysobacter sp. KIS68-7]|uniref:DUF3426 domain-containing protein n=1 Tax=Lysobacter sp. KIS68-7 TaxID=2904252 RepID=UPI001E658025|nr:DUF3426 domain-containing protein [Lysobacter sp. KIS68-7]UHQ20779.1 DUF3426 domain-containing protein [Lysobacter sp. KIS68-7]